MKTSDLMMKARELIMGVLIGLACSAIWGGLPLRAQEQDEWLSYQSPPYEWTGGNQLQLLLPLTPAVPRREQDYLLPPLPPIPSYQPCP